jgi:hypothetical protein
MKNSLQYASPNPRHELAWIENGKSVEAYERVGKPENEKNYGSTKGAVRRPLEQGGELTKVVGVQVGYGPVAHSTGIEIRRIITAVIRDSNGTVGAFCRWPDKNIDEVLPVTVDNCRRRLSANVIQSTAEKWEAFAGEVGHRRREVQPVGEPRLDGMPFRRR